MKIDWFFESKNKMSHNRQKGLYNLLVVQKKIPVETLIEIMSKYREEVIAKCTSNKKRAPYIGSHWKFHILKHACDDIFFKSFLEMVTRETGITFKKRRNERYYDDFSERQLEYMLHGGSVDDF